MHLDVYYHIGAYYGDGRNNQLRRYTWSPSGGNVKNNTCLRLWSVRYVLVICNKILNELTTDTAILNGF
jgi:hypothetical protein